MTSSELPNVFLLQFAPEQWTPLRKLRYFLGPPLPPDGNVRIGLRDCEQHLDKVEVLWRVADRLRPNLALDREELDRFGGTSNLHSQELAAVYESIICALYSALDGLRTFIFGLYRNVPRVQNGSNGKLFDRAAGKEYGPAFSEEIRVLLAEARDSWFLRLREIRTELTHGSTGTCHLDKATKEVRYLNEGVKRDGGAFFLDDIEGVLRTFDRQVRELVYSIAAHFFPQLEPTPQFHMCGMYRGRWYGRMVAAAPDVSFADGHCLSYDWFEKESGYFCPLAGRCPAYERKWPGGSAAVSGMGKSATAPDLTAAS